MAKNRPGVMLYFETLQAIDELDAEDVKQIMSAILHYCRDGEEPVFRGIPAALWHLIRGGLDRDGERYSKKQLRGNWLVYCRKCKRQDKSPLSFDDWVNKQYVNGTLSYVERAVDDAVNVAQPTTSTSPSTTTTTSTSTSTSPSPTKESDSRQRAARARFVPPTLDEVRAYCRDLQSSIDPERFVDYYQTRGWECKGGQPMKDWKAAVRSWEKMELQQSGYSPEAAPNTDPLKGFRKKAPQRSECETGEIVLSDLLKGFYTEDEEEQ